MTLAALPIHPAHSLLSVVAARLKVSRQVEAAISATHGVDQGAEGQAKLLMGYSLHQEAEIRIASDSKQISDRSQVRQDPLTCERPLQMLREMPAMQGTVAPTAAARTLGTALPSAADNSCRTTSVPGRRPSPPSHDAVRASRRAASSAIWSVLPSGAFACVGRCIKWIEQRFHAGLPLRDLRPSIYDRKHTRADGNLVSTLTCPKQNPTP